MAEKFPKGCIVTADNHKPLTVVALMHGGDTLEAPWRDGDKSFTLPGGPEKRFLVGELLDCKQMAYIPESLAVLLNEYTDQKAEEPDVEHDEEHDAEPDVEPDCVVLLTQSIGGLDEKL